MPELLCACPNHKKYSSETLSTVKATPWDIHTATEPEVVFKPREEGPEAEPRDDAVPQRRRMYIKQADIDAFGYTTGCPRCDHAMRYGPNRTAKGHNDKCRERIMAELAKTPEGQARIARMNVRIEETAAEAIERAETHPGPAAQGEIGGVSRRPEIKFLPFTDATTSLPAETRDDVRPPIATETTTTGPVAQIPNDMADHDFNGEPDEIPGEISEKQVKWT